MPTSESSPQDQLAKALLPAWLSPWLGKATPGYPIASEARQGDVDFVPKPSVLATEPHRLALGELVATFLRVPRLFEVYRNPVTAEELQESAAKTLELLNARRRLLRRARAGRRAAPTPGPAPELCLITPTLSPGLLPWMCAVNRPGGPAGVYVLPGIIPGVVIVVHQLPVVPATLWFRLLGRDEVQQQAMLEVEALPSTHPLQHDTMYALSAYRQQLQQQRTPMDQDDRQFLRNTQRLYEKWERQTIARGKAEGEAKGKAEAVLAILEARGLVVKAAARKQIVATTDLGQLEAWVRAAVTVASVDALLPPTAAPRRKASRPRK